MMTAQNTAKGHKPHFTVCLCVGCVHACVCVGSPHTCTWVRVTEQGRVNGNCCTV